MNMSIYLFVGIMLLIAIEPWLCELEEVIEWIIFHPIKTMRNIKSYVEGKYGQMA